jgi:hypothetical protein
MGDFVQRMDEVANILRGIRRENQSTFGFRLVLKWVMYFVKWMKCHIAKQISC